MFGHSWDSRAARWLSTPLALLIIVMAVIAFGPVIAPAAGLGLAVLGDTTAVADLTAIQKVVASKPLYNDVVIESDFQDLIATTSEGIMVDRTTGGRYVENAHLKGLMGGYGARGETDNLPVAQKPTFFNSRVPLTESHGTLEMTSRTMDLVRTDEAAFMDYLDEALPLFARKVAHEDDRELLGYGYGVRARISSITDLGGGSYRLGVDRLYGIDDFEDAWLAFMENDSLVFTSSLTAPITLRNPGTSQAALVTDLDEENATIDVTAAAGLAAVWAQNDYIGTGDAQGHSFPEGSPAVEKWFDGFLAAIDDGGIKATYMNVTRASNRLFRSIVIDGSAAPWNGSLTENLIDFGLDECSLKGGGKPTVFVCAKNGERALRKDFKADRFFQDPRGFVGGKLPVYVLIGGVPYLIRVARKVPPNVFFGMQMDTWTRFSPQEFEWDDKTGSIWNRTIDVTTGGRKSAYFCTGYKYDQYFNRAPRKSFRIDGLAKVS